MTVANDAPAAWPPLVSSAQLAGWLGLTPGEAASHPAVVPVDCRFNLMKPDAGRAAWQAGHIPGAWFADLDQDLAAPRTADSGRHPLPDPARLRELFSRFGIGPDTPVVVYDEGGGALAARLWWLLRWMGHARVSLLDGGLGAWERAGLPVTTEVPAARPARFAGQPGHMPTVDVATLAGRLGRGDLRLLDARAPERFHGRTEPIDPVGGHVPGAVNAPFGGNLGADGRFRPAAELAARYRELTGGRPASDVVCMCGSGVTACHAILALEIAGLPRATLYPGSWSEWIRAPDRPVARE